jgi:hypothetical protein
VRLFPRKKLLSIEAPATSLIPNKIQFYRVSDLVGLFSKEVIDLNKIQKLQLFNQLKVNLTANFFPKRLSLTKFVQYRSLLPPTFSGPTQGKEAISGLKRLIRPSLKVARQSLVKYYMFIETSKSPSIRKHKRLLFSAFFSYYNVANTAVTTLTRLSRVISLRFAVTLGARSSVSLVRGFFNHHLTSYSSNLVDLKG